MRSIPFLRRPITVYASFVLPLMFLFGIFCPDKVVPPPDTGYKAPTSVENVISNIQNLYIKRDVVEYDSTLASDYVFRFQPGEIQNGVDSLSRAEEMSFADHLFLHGSASGEPAASQIRLTLITQTIAGDSRVGHSGWQRAIVSTHLVTTTADGSSGWEVSSPAWFYFRQQPEGSGRWRLAEWADQPGTAGAPATTARAVTYGRLRGEELKGGRIAAR